MWLCDGLFGCGCGCGCGCVFRGQRNSLGVGFSLLPCFQVCVWGGAEVGLYHFCWICNILQAWWPVSFQPGLLSSPPHLAGIIDVHWHFWFFLGLTLDQQACEARPFVYWAISLDWNRFLFKKILFTNYFIHLHPKCCPSLSQSPPPLLPYPLHLWEGPPPPYPPTLGHQVSTGLVKSSPTEARPGSFRNVLNAVTAFWDSLRVKGPTVVLEEKAQNLSPFLSSATEQSQWTQILWWHGSGGWGVESALCAWAFSDLIQVLGGAGSQELSSVTQCTCAKLKQ